MLRAPKGRRRSPNVASARTRTAVVTAKTAIWIVALTMFFVIVEDVIVEDVMVVVIVEMDVEKHWEPVVLVSLDV